MSQLTALRIEVHQMQGAPRALGPGKGTAKGAAKGADSQLTASAGVQDISARLERLEAKVSMDSDFLLVTGGKPPLQGSPLAAAAAPPQKLLGAAPGAWQLASAGPPRGRATAGGRAASLVAQGAELADDAVVTLEASIWDCALVIILHQGCSSFRDPRQQWYLGSFNIVLTWALLFFNLTVQVFFIIAVHSMSTPDPFASIHESILDERLISGHDYWHMDKKTMTTRTERTCNNQVYDSLTRTVSTLSQYLNLDADKGLLALPGSAICFLAMLFWVIEMTVEIRRCADLLLVVLALPHSHCTVIEESGGQHLVKAVTRFHKLLSILFVLAPRFTISLFLLSYGKRFLAGTIDIGELILNTCALEFVRNVDDMIFEAMATRTLILFTNTARILRTYALSQQPLLDSSSEQDFILTGYIPPKVARMQGWPMETFNVLMAVLFVVVTSFQGYTSLIQPFVDSASSVYSDVCDRNTRFTYIFHPVTSTPVFSQADKSPEELINVRCFYVSQYESVRIRAGFAPMHFPANASLAALINGSDPRCRAPPGQESPIACPERGLNTLSKLAVISEAGFFASRECRDQDVAVGVLRATCLSETFFNVSEEELSFFQDLWRCEDLVSRCRSTRRYNISQNWISKIQRVCPRTCGMCTSGEVEAS